MEKLSQLIKDLHEGTKSEPARVSWRLHENNRYRTVFECAVIEIGGDATPKALCDHLRARWYEKGYKKAIEIFDAWLEDKVPHPKVQDAVPWPARRISVMTAEGAVLHSWDIERGNQKLYELIALLFLEITDQAQMQAVSAIDSILAELASRPQPKSDESLPTAASAK